MQCQFFDIGRAAGGEVSSFTDDESEQPLDCVLVDAGNGPSPDPRATPDPSVASLVLVTPAARGRLAELTAMGFGGYLVKPVRQVSLIERVLLKARAEAAPHEMLPPAAAALPALPPRARTISSTG